MPRKLSIRNKVILVTTICSSIALALSAIGFVVYNVRTIRESQVEQIVTQARMIAFNSTAVVTFHDKTAATELLAGLESQPAVEFASLIDSAGMELASYRNETAASHRYVVDVDSINAGSSYEFTDDGHLHMYHEIVDDGNVVGLLFLRASMADLHRKLGDYAKISVGVLICALAVSIGFSLLLQRTITQPIVQLAQTAEEITTGHDYSIRVAPQSADEIGLLYRSFNTMLQEIETSRNALKSSVANMSHEIRTPINALLGFTDVLLRRGDDVGPKERDEYLQTIRASGRHLLDLINDVLDLSKIEAGQLEIENIEVSPHQVIAEVVSVLRVRAMEKQVSLEYEWAGGVPETINTDPGRFRQILLNLIGNAIKFTNIGAIRVVARLVHQEETPRLEVDIIDSGIGIPQDKLELIFTPFTQADNTVTRRFGGTGLGLAICRQLAIALGGSLAVKSDHGLGSTFTVSIDAGSLDGVRILEKPIRDIGDSTKEFDPVELGAIKNRRVLAVDDGTTNRQLIDIILSDAGMHVSMAENGQIAVELATQQPFDLILMDMQMPVMDGYTATRRLRDAGLTIPILALTAHAMKGDHADCLAAGCSGYLTKPIDANVLLEAIADALAHGQSEAASRNRTDPVQHATSPIASIYPMDNPRFRQLALDFVQCARAQIQSMKAEWAARDFEALRRLAHALKGAGGTAGFPDFTDPAGQLEERAIAQSPDGVNELIGQLENLIDRITIVKQDTPADSSISTAN